MSLHFKYYDKSLLTSYWHKSAKIWSFYIKKYALKYNLWLKKLFGNKSIYALQDPYGKKVTDKN